MQQLRLDIPALKSLVCRGPSEMPSSQHSIALRARDICSAAGSRMYQKMNTTRWFLSCWTSNYWLLGSNLRQNVWDCLKKLNVWKMRSSMIAQRECDKIEMGSKLDSWRDVIGHWWHDYSRATLSPALDISTHKKWSSCHHKHKHTTRKPPTRSQAHSSEDRKIIQCPLQIPTLLSQQRIPIDPASLQ